MIKKPWYKHEIFIGTCIALITILVISGLNFSDITGAVTAKNELTQLQQEYNELAQKYKSNINDYNNLNGQYNDLLKKHKTRTNEYNQLVEEYNDLSNQCNKLSRECQEMAYDYQNCKQELGEYAGIGNVINTVSKILPLLAMI
jgi:uncharacterized coiled-coil DUF342 family protein